MRFLHTADWHLGRCFHGTRLTADQAHILDRFVELAAAEKPDAILIAGDVYDRALPAPEAVELLDDVLARLVLKLEIPVVLIAGNHDSPVRLDFAAGLLRRQRLHVAGSFVPDPRAIPFTDAHGEVLVYPLPYAEPAAVRQALQPPPAEAPDPETQKQEPDQPDLFAAEEAAAERIDNHPKAVAAALGRIRAAHPAGRRAILLGHAFVSGGVNTPDSERPLSIGGAECVDPALFAGFHYVALGHLHQPQSLGDGDGTSIHYSGSLLKYSFAEAAHRKSVSLVEMDGAGACRIKKIPLAPLRDVRRIEGTLEALMTREPPSDDYLLVTLTDAGALHDPLSRLRARFPNVMQLGQPALAGGAEPGAFDLLGTVDEPVDVLFNRFFETVTGAAATEEELAAFRAAAEAAERKGREALAGGGD